MAQYARIVRYIFNHNYDIKEKMENDSNDTYGQLQLDLHICAVFNSYLKNKVNDYFHIHTKNFHNFKISNNVRNNRKFNNNISFNNNIVKINKNNSNNSNNNSDNNSDNNNIVKINKNNINFNNNNIVKIDKNNLSFNNNNIVNKNNLSFNTNTVKIENNNDKFLRYHGYVDITSKVYDAILSKFKKNRFNMFSRENVTIYLKDYNVEGNNTNAVIKSTITECDQLIKEFWNKYSMTDLITLLKYFSGKKIKNCFYKKDKIYKKNDNSQTDTTNNYFVVNQDDPPIPYNKHIIISFRGTEVTSLSNLSADLTLVFNKDTSVISSRFYKSVQFYILITKLFTNTRFTMASHSLGGSITEYVNIKYKTLYNLNEVEHNNLFYLQEKTIPDVIYTINRGQGLRRNMIEALSKKLNKSIKYLLKFFSTDETYLEHNHIDLVAENYDWISTFARYQPVSNGLRIFCTSHITPKNKYKGNHGINKLVYPQNITQILKYKTNSFKTIIKKNGDVDLIPFDPLNNT
jgi:hypothetical protein